MKLKSIVAAVAIAASSFGAFAALNPVSVTGDFTNANLGTFEVLSTSNVTGSLGFATSITFPSFTLALSDVTFSGSSISGFSGIGNTFSWNNVSAGVYNLFASGSTSGTGLIAANVNITPVPEPESYAMLLAGLGLMGIIARRRSGKAAD